MGLVWSSANSDASPAGVPVDKTNETAMAPGDVLAWDRANNALERATSSTVVHDMFGVCKQTRVAGDAQVVAIPFSPGQIWEADLNANSASSMNGERMALTDHDTVNNSGTDVTGDTGLFVQLSPVGATGDNKSLLMPLGPIGVST